MSFQDFILFLLFVFNAYLLYTLYERSLKNVQQDLYSYNNTHRILKNEEFLHHIWIKLYQTTIKAIDKVVYFIIIVYLSAILIAIPIYFLNLPKYFNYDKNSTVQNAPIIQNFYNGILPDNKNYLQTPETSEINSKVTENIQVTENIENVEPIIDNTIPLENTTIPLENTTIPLENTTIPL